MWLKIVACLALVFTARADEFTNTFFKETRLSSLAGTNLYMLEGAGGNITALIGNEGVLLVDSDFAEMSDKLSAKLKELKGGSPRFIVNTHFHYDHSGGNEVFGSTATIIAARAVRDRLQTEQTLWKKQHPPLSPQAWPTVIVENQMKVQLNGEDVRIVHLPRGHTDGDTIVFFTQHKVASLGDLYFSGMYPIFHHEHQGSFRGYVESLQWILKELPEDYKIVSGHGPWSTKTDLKRYLQMILASEATVREGMRQKLSLSQIQKKGLDPEWEPYSHGYVTTDRWIEMLYKEFDRQRPPRREHRGL